MVVGVGLIVGVGVAVGLVVGVGVAVGVGNPSQFSIDLVIQPSLSIIFTITAGTLVNPLGKVIETDGGIGPTSVETTSQ